MSGHPDADNWPALNDPVLAAFAAAPSSVLILDGSMRVVWASPSTLVRSAVSPTEVRDRVLYELYPDGPAGERARWLRTAMDVGRTALSGPGPLEDERTTTVSVPLTATDGTRYLGVEGQVDDDAEPPGGVADEPARQAVFDLITDTAEVAIWDWNRHTNELHWNEWHARYFGLEADATPRPYADFVSRVHPDDAPAVEAAVADAIEHDTLYRSRFRVLVPDGSVRWLCAQGRLVRSDPYRMVGIALDVTAQVEAQERERHLLTVLNDAEQRVRAGLGAEIHDGPLQHLFVANLAIDAIARGMDRDPGDRERIRKRLAQAGAALEKAQVELRALLAVLNPHRSGEVVDLRVALPDLARDMFRNRPERVEVEIELGGPVPGDLARVALQISAEAMQNVRKHADATAVRLAASEVDRSIVLRIGDDGCGFDPAAPPPSGHFGHIVMRYRAEAAGGRLSVVSDAGTGTTVTASLPLGEP